MNRVTAAEIAPAIPGDAIPICRVIAETWLATYPNLQHGITEEVIRGFHYEADGSLNKANVDKTERNILALGHTDRHAVYTAKVADQVIGVSSGTVSETGKRKLNVIFILPNFQGQGIGPRLRDEVLNWHGPQDIYLKVVRYNHRAIRFHVKSGFEPIGPVARADQFTFANGVVLPEMEMLKKYTRT